MLRESRAIRPSPDAVPLPRPDHVPSAYTDGCSFLSSNVVETTGLRDSLDGEAEAHITVRAEVQEVETGVRRIYSSALRDVLR